MSKILTRSMLALAASAPLLPAQAQNYAGLPSFFAGPLTQLGSTVNGFLLLSTTAGITTSGQVTINLPAGPGNGNLLQFVVDRPFNVALNQPFTTSIDLDGFSLPPPGTAGNTGGAARTYVVDTSPAHNTMPGTTANLPLSLVAGIANWPVSNPPVTSPTFTLTAGNYLLRQVFDLDGVYLAGGGGTWVVDFPLISSLNPVPEPSTWALMAAGLAGLGTARRQLRRSKPADLARSQAPTPLALHTAPAH